jgi:hypothetical protein
MAIEYLVASPGRSGSVFACLVIAKALDMRVIAGNWRNFSLDRPTVLHSHEAKLQIHKDVCVVQVHRKDVFAQVISAIIAEQYNEWASYDPVGKQPFVADIDTFYDKYTWHKKWHQAFEHYTQYTNVQHVWFEDFIGDAEKLCALLNIPTKPNLPKSQKSPYGHERILNIDQLQQEYQRLEQDQELQQRAIYEFNWEDLKLNE